MNRRSWTGSLVGSSNLAVPANSIMVSGRSAASRWVCSSALGSRAISSRVSIALLGGAARAHHDPEDGALRQARLRPDLDAPRVGDEGGAAGELLRQLRIERAHGGADIGTSGDLEWHGIDEH